MTRLNWISFLVISLTLPIECEAFTWGDFHVFAVIFFSFLGGFLGLGAIFGAMYLACGKPFFNRFQNEVAETHREHHPWPPGSVRWRLQQLVRSDRQTGETRFSAQKPPQDFSTMFPSQSGFEYPAAQNTTKYLYQRALDYCGGDQERGLDREPIISSKIGAYYPQRQSSGGADRTTSAFERPTYFTQTLEKNLAPVCEKVEEYRVVREESFLSSTGGTQQQPQYTTRNVDTLSPQDVKVVRTTSTVHSSSRRQKSPSHLPYTYI